MKFSTIPRVSARARRERNPWIVGNDLGPVPRARVQKKRRVKQEPKPAPGHEYEPCAYCGKAMGITRDHVVPKSYRVKGVEIPEALSATVAACYPCNLRKGARRLIPASWAGRIEELAAAFPGTQWRVWRGGSDEPAFREVHS